MSVSQAQWARLTNGGAIELDGIPTFSIDAWQAAILDAVAEGQRAVALFGAAIAAETCLYAILAHDEYNVLHVARARLDGKAFPSLTPRCPQVHLFEREIAEQFGIEPTGHPWLKAVRFAREQGSLPGVVDFYRVEGDEVHEVAVGPVHAGVIEPGHFRFQCHGEEVYHLEIALGYQHRGVEEAMLGGPHSRCMMYAETIAGDTTIAHATAYAQAVEALTRCKATPRAQALRGIALELERLANHVGDLGALANDVGYLPTANYCGRIRGDLLNMTAVLCGSRFGRGLVRPGGVGFDVDERRIGELLRRLDAAERDAAVAINLLWDTPIVVARFQDTGRLPRQVAVDLGIVGLAARAAGLARDGRHDQPTGIFRFAHIPVSTYDTGDVFARAYVRWLEIQQSTEFVREQLHALPGGAPRVSLGDLAPHRLAVVLHEGWRGEVCHVAIADAAGRFARYKIVDPSFHNWTALAYVLRNQPISDFPLCNKSFNLSYCGHDL